MRLFRTIIRFRAIASILDLSWVHTELVPFYLRWADPRLIRNVSRMLIIGYAVGLCCDVGVNLARPLESEFACFPAARVGRSLALRFSGRSAAVVRA